MRFDDKYKEVRCTYYDEYAHYWHVDAWKTDDDNESGRTVAVINDAGGVFYADPDAQLCTMVVECINEKLREIEEDSIKVGEPEIVDIVLDMHRHPNAYNAKKEELMNGGMSSQEAMRFLYQPIEVEIFYSPNQGLFAVESEALGQIGFDIVNPYDGKVLIQED